jgi:hypothetical protein
VPLGQQGHVAMVGSTVYVPPLHCCYLCDSLLFVMLTEYSAYFLLRSAHVVGVVAFVVAGQ